MKLYDIIYADPPWLYWGDPNKMGAAGKEYSLMPTEEISNLKVSIPSADIEDMLVKQIAAKLCVLFMWTTSSQMPNALVVMNRWGFTYRGISHVWVKTTKQGKIISGQGVRPTFTKPTTELLLVGSTNKKGRTFPILDEAQPQVVLHPRLSHHSEKPAVFRSLIEKLFKPLPDRPYNMLEMFARKGSPGWDVFGNQTTLLDEPQLSLVD